MELMYIGSIVIVSIVVSWATKNVLSFIGNLQESIIYTQRQIDDTREFCEELVERLRTQLAADQQAEEYRQQTASVDIDRRFEEVYRQISDGQDQLRRELAE